MSQKGNCAHLRIEYEKCHEVGNDNGPFWDEWRCLECRSEFGPVQALRAENAELRARAESAEAQIAKLRKEASATLIDDFTGQQSRDNRKLRDENADLRKQLREKTDDLAEVLRGCEKLKAQLDAATVREAALREVLKKACPCRGTGKRQSACTMCGDSTFDHVCDDEVEPCPNGCADLQPLPDVDFLLKARAWADAEMDYNDGYGPMRHLGLERGQDKGARADEARDAAIAARRREKS